MYHWNIISLELKIIFDYSDIFRRSFPIVQCIQCLHFFYDFLYHLSVWVHKRSFLCTESRSNLRTTLTNTQLWNYEIAEETEIWFWHFAVDVWSYLTITVCMNSESPRKTAGREVNWDLCTTQCIWSARRNHTDQTLALPWPVLLRHYWIMTTHRSNILNFFLQNSNVMIDWWKNHPFN